MHKVQALYEKSKKIVLDPKDQELMRMDAARPFAFSPIIETSCVDTAEWTLSQYLYKLRLGRVENPRDFHLLMTGVMAGEVFLGFNRYGSDTEIASSSSAAAVTVALPYEGLNPAIFTLDGEVVACTRETGPIVSEGRQLSINRPKGSGILVVRASNAPLRRRFLEASGSEMRGLPRFDRYVDWKSEQGAGFLNMVRFLVSELSRDPRILKSPLLKAGISDMLLGAILALPGPHLASLHRQAREAPPRIVRLAEEYLKAHASEPVKISDVLEICGCSRSALFLAFQRHREYTPIQFLQNVRLESAHTRLLQAEPHESVTSIAYGSGFINPGRFSAAYRHRFGESPSETLKRARSY